MENRNIEGRSKSPGSGDRAGAGSRTGSVEKPWVTGLFTDRDRAERGYQALTARGYDAKDINMVMSDDTRKRYFTSGEQTELGTKAAKGAGVGGASAERSVQLPRRLLRSALLSRYRASA